MDHDSRAEKLRQDLVGQFGGISPPDEVTIIPSASQYPTDIGPFALALRQLNHWEGMPPTLVFENVAALCEFDSEVLPFFIAGFLWCGLGSSELAKPILARTFDALEMRGFWNKNSADRVYLTPGQYAVVLSALRFALRDVSVPLLDQTRVAARAINS